MKAAPSPGAVFSLSGDAWQVLDPTLQIFRRNQDAPSHSSRCEAPACNLLTNFGVTNMGRFRGVVDVKEHPIRHECVPFIGRYVTVRRAICKNAALHF
jgi:hypothetical protein